MSGFENEIIVAKGINLTGASPPSNQLGTDGYLLIGSTAGDPQGAPLTAGAGIIITNGSGSISISSIGGGITWSAIGASQTLVNNEGYICNAGGAISLALPAAASVGDSIEVALSGSTSWTITQGAGQQIRLGNTTTTAGVGGSLASTAQGDWVRLVCYVSGTSWIACAEQGNITVV